MTLYTVLETPDCPLASPCLLSIGADDAVFIRLCPRVYAWLKRQVEKSESEFARGKISKEVLDSIHAKMAPIVEWARANLVSQWDNERLPLELAELQEMDFDLEFTGFSGDELQRLLDSGTNAGFADPDAVPEPPDEATTRPGDLWILGKHRLLCGNSGSPEDVDRLLNGAEIHLVNTDPPYGVKVEPRSNNAIAAGLSSFQQPERSGHESLRHAEGERHHHQSLDLARHPEKSNATHKKLRPKDRPLANDFVSDEEFDRLLHAWFGNIARVLIPGGSFYLWGGYANVANYPPVLKATGLYFSQWIIWVKEHPVLTRKDFLGNHEVCYYGWKEGAAHRWFGPNNAVDVWPIKKVNPQNMIHLCLHPDALVLTEAGYRPMRTIRSGDRVFSGDGTFHDVTHISTHAYTSECLYRITAKGGNLTSDASDNHPFLIWRPIRRGRRFVGGTVAWVPANEMQVGDYTMTPILTSDSPDPFPERDENYWFLFGLYLAQDHLQHAGHGDRRYPAFSIHKKRQDLATRIGRQWANASEYDRNDYGSTPSSGLTVMAFDGDAGEQFDMLGGRHAHSKRLAPIIFSLPHAKRSAILHGWLNGDGCKVHDRGYWQGNTVSSDLAAHLCLLAESVGYRANIFAYDPPEDMGGIGGRLFKSRRRVYCLYFYERTQLANRGCPTWMEYDGREYSLRFVKSIERIPYDGLVWNLSVDGHPSFQTAVGLSHNTEKPVELAARAMEYSSRPGENVLDLFGGSGSTLIAAEQTGRKAFLMEIDPPYCDVIRQRWEQFAGKQAELAAADDVDCGRPAK
jgi:DNA modification methylase